MKNFIAIAFFLSVLLIIQRDAFALGTTAPEVSVGSTFSCALKEKKVFCWGGKPYQSLYSVPAELGDVEKLSVGAHHVCAIQADKMLRCWGSNSNGMATPPKDLGKVLDVSLGSKHTCALTENNLVRCWGNVIDEEWGQTKVPSDLENVTSVIAGNLFSCATTKTGIRCWGIISDDDIPQNLGKISYIYSGNLSGSVCAMTASGNVCWGDQLHQLPTEMINGGKLASNGGLACLSPLSGGIKCWRYMGKEYNEKWGVQYSSEQVGNPSSFAHAYRYNSFDSTFFCAGYNNGKVQCWGYNEHGQTDVPAELR